MEKIEFPIKIVTRSKPGVTLKKKEEYHDGSSACDFGDFVIGNKGCLSGLTYFY